MKSVKSGSVMVHTGVLSVCTIIFCHRGDDLTDAARVAVSPPLLPTGATWWKSLQPMNGMPPNGSSKQFVISKQRRCMHSQLALFAMGSSSQKMASAWHMRSALEEVCDMEECKLVLSLVTGIPNRWCAVWPHSYAIAERALLLMMRMILCLVRSEVIRDFIRKLFPLPGFPSTKNMLFLLSHIWSWMEWKTAHCSSLRWACMSSLHATKRSWEQRRKMISSISSLVVWFGIGSPKSVNLLSPWAR